MLAASTFTFSVGDLGYYGVSEPSSSDGEFSVRSPLACYFTCHHRDGIELVSDDVRPSIELEPSVYSPAALERLRALYPGQAALDRVLAGEDLGRHYATQRALRVVPSNTTNPLADRLFSARTGPQFVAETMGLTMEVMLRELAADYPALTAEVVDRAALRAAFAGAICRAHASSRNQPRTDFCGAAP